MPGEHDAAVGLDEGCKGPVDVAIEIDGGRTVDTEARIDPAIGVEACTCKVVGCATTREAGHHDLPVGLNHHVLQRSAAPAIEAYGDHSTRPERRVQYSICVVSGEPGTADRQDSAVLQGQRGRGT